MIDALLDMPTLVAAGLCGVAGMAVTIGIITILRWLFPVPTSEPTVELARQVQFRVGVVHGLIIALIFAEAMVEAREVRGQIAREAAAIADLYGIMDNFESDESEQVQRLVRRYVREVIDAEWPLLSGDTLAPEVTNLYDEIYKRALSLHPKNDGERLMLQSVSQDLRVIGDLRQHRLYESRDRLPETFWHIMIIGTIAVALFFAVYPLTPINIVLICGFPFINFAVLFYVFALGDPFDEHIGVSARPFVLLYENISEHELGPNPHS